MSKLTLNSIRDALNKSVESNTADGTDLSIATMTSKLKTKVEKEVVKAAMGGDMETVTALTSVLTRYAAMSISDSKGLIIEHLETLSPDDSLTVVVDKDTSEEFIISDIIEFLKTSPACESDKVKISDLFVSLLKGDGIDTTFEVQAMPKKAVVKDIPTFSMVRDTILTFNEMPETERHGSKAKSYENENYQLFWNSELLLSLEGHTITRQNGKLRAVKFKK